MFFLRSLECAQGSLLKTLVTLPRRTSSSTSLTSYFTRGLSKRAVSLTKMFREQYGSEVETHLHNTTTHHSTDDSRITHSVCGNEAVLVTGQESRRTHLITPLTHLDHRTLGQPRSFPELGEGRILLSGSVLPSATFVFSSNRFR